MDAIKNFILGKNHKLWYFICSFCSAVLLYNTVVLLMLNQKSTAIYCALFSLLNLYMTRLHGSFLTQKSDDEQD
jgi:hypothetical protein